MKDKDKGSDVQWLVDHLDHRQQQLEYEQTIAAYWARLHLEALIQIVRRKPADAEIESDPDLAIVLMSLGYHDPAVPTHDDEIPLLEAMRRKR